MGNVAAFMTVVSRNFEDRTTQPVNLSSCLRWERRSPTGRIRYYEARLQEDLLGDWTVVRTWGARGEGAGSMALDWVSGPDDGLRLLRRLVAQRRRQGYQPVRGDLTLLLTT